MNAKNFLIGGIFGGVIYFLCGWLFYGSLFKEYFGSTGNENMIAITCGSFTFGFMMSYIFNGISYVSGALNGLKIGAVIGLFLGLYTNFFTGFMTTPNYEKIGLDIAIMVVMSGVTGIAVALVNGKAK